MAANSANISGLPPGTRTYVSQSFIGTPRGQKQVLKVSAVAIAIIAMAMGVFGLPLSSPVCIIPILSVAAILVINSLRSTTQIYTYE